MRPGRRAELTARALLTLAALVPYWRLLTFSVVLATDDYFTSDIYNGELPGRVLVGEALRSGHWPLWTNAMCSGYPLAGAPSDPIGLALFTVLPPAPALDALLVLILLVAAHGTYTLARRFGVDRTAAVLAGVAFAGSGYIATQLKHLSIMSTIAWLPLGLVLIDHLFTTERKRPLILAALGLLYANQVLAGFPQSAYICGLVYGLFTLFRLFEYRDRFAHGHAWLRLLGGLAAALLLGAAAGAIVLLPLADLTTFTDRVTPLDYHWASFTNFWPRNVFTFFIPYINGDATNGTYIGPPPFWENYGYAGAATAVLAIFGAAREWRRPVVAFASVMTLMAFAFMLGPHTPIYYAAFMLIPGMGRFRAPTRFMVAVDLGLALLGAIGLNRLRLDLERWRPASRLPHVLVVAICAATAVDLFVHQPRQNTIVSARTWLAPPPTVAAIRADSTTPRTFAPHHRDVHRRLNETNHGWANIEPYYELRDLLAPDTGGAYWHIPSADCYVGLAPRWYVLVWSYHYFEKSFIYDAAFEEFDTRTLSIKPGFLTMMRTYGVTHVLSPFPASAGGLTPVAHEPNAYVYRVEGAARVRVVSAARAMATEAQVVARLRESSFDPDREILLLDAPPSVHPLAADVTDGGGGERGKAAIVRDDPREVDIDATSPRDAFLLLADMYYPGWTATVDGAETPVYRADVSLRGIALPKGHHVVRFTFESAPFLRGLWISGASLAALGVWFGLALYGSRA